MVNGQFANCDLGFNSVTVGNLNLNRGTITGSGIVTVNGPLEWNEGSLRGQGTTNANNGVFFNGLTGSSGFNVLDRTLNCYGNSSVQTTNAYFGYLNFGLNAALNIMPGATFNGSRLMVSGSSTGGQTNGIVRNYGTLVIDDPGVNRGMAVLGTAFVNEGMIRITNSLLDVRGTGGLPFVQNAGSVQLTNGKLASEPTTINGGSLTGYGTMVNVVNNGIIAPSDRLMCSGTLSLLAGSVLAFDLNWNNGALFFGYITNASTASLGGALQVTLSGGAQSHILPSNSFTVVSAQSVTGHFTNVASGGRLSTTDGSGSFLVTYGGGQVVLSDFQPN